jgi:hypothetical protein
MAIETLEDIFTTFNARITATATEIDAWKTLDPVQISSADNIVVTRVGLFGADLTDFNAVCAAFEDLCDIADYADYNGWGVGVNWESPEDVTADQVDGVAFATSRWTVQVTWKDPSLLEAHSNVIESSISKVAIAADAPADDEVNRFEAAEDAFEAWAAFPTDLTWGFQFTFSFFHTAYYDDFYFEVGDVESVWATFGAVADVDGNVETAKFEFVGAAYLTAASSVIFAALLF